MRDRFFQVASLAAKAFAGGMIETPYDCPAQTHSGIVEGRAQDPPDDGALKQIPTKVPPKVPPILLRYASKVFKMMEPPAGIEPATC